MHQSSIPWTTNRGGRPFPRWIDRRTNLREVAPGLYIGDQESPALGRWALVVDLCGASSRYGTGQYGRARLVVHPFSDGDPIPAGLLTWLAPRVERVVKSGRRVLLHCAAGESRSVSVAYALLRIGWGLSHEEALRRVQTPNSIPRNWPVPTTFQSAREWVWREGERQAWRRERERV